METERDFLSQIGDLKEVGKEDFLTNCAPKRGERGFFRKNPDSSTHLSPLAFFKVEEGRKSHPTQPLTAGQDPPPLFFKSFQLIVKILALTFPEEYGVIDFRAWRQLFGEEKRGFSTEDYKQYLNKLRNLAKELGWTVQEVDLAIWAYDKSINKNKKK